MMQEGAQRAAKAAAMLRKLVPHADVAAQLNERGTGWYSFLSILDGSTAPE